MYRRLPERLGTDDAMPLYISNMTTEGLRADDNRNKNWSTMNGQPMLLDLLQMTFPRATRSM